MSLNDEEKQMVIAYRLDKASKTLNEAQKVIELGLWATAANRLYYAAYYAVSSLLIANGLNAKTHEGIIRMFNMHFINTGKIEMELGRQYNRLFTMRITGDYGDCFDLQETDVKPLVEPASQLITKVISLVQQKIQ
jgi:uncharacterized protein (UPF0332 family)